MSHRILLIDDDDKVLGMLQRYLGATLGYDVTAVKDGQSAVDAAMEQSFDLCIVDVHMPGISGTETYTRLRNVCPNIEAIFFTADNDFERTLDFLRFALPTERVLTKPLENLSRLTQLIIGILGPPVV
jgi:CheY-like chemotaxis protein